VNDLSGGSRCCNYLPTAVNRLAIYRVVTGSGASDGARLRLFALSATAELGEAIAQALGIPLAAHEERQFEDGEHKTRPLDTVGGMDIYIVQSLHGGPSESANDKLCRLLFFIGALKDAGAARVTAIVPYLCYARKDRRTKPNASAAPATEHSRWMERSSRLNCVRPSPVAQQSPQAEVISSALTSLQKMRLRSFRNHGAVDLVLPELAQGIFM
jgi:phosphoribosylpyrophosphate synthetase